MGIENPISFNVSAVRGSKKKPGCASVNNVAHKFVEERKE